MTTTNEYLNKAIEKLGLSNDYQLAKFLNLSSGSTTLWRQGKRTIDNYTAARLAEILEIDAMEIIAAAELEREKNEGERREFWKRLAGGTKGAVLAFALAAGGIQEPGPGPTAHNAYYGNNRRKFRPWMDALYKIRGMDRRKAA